MRDRLARHSKNDIWSAVAEMGKMPDTCRQQFNATVADDGRVVIPAALREALGIAGQRAEVFFELRGNQVTLTTRMRELRRAQDRIAGIAQTGPKLASDELIEDRRADARRRTGDA